MDVKRDEEEKEMKTAKAFVALAQGAPAAKRSVENVKKWEASLQWRRQLDALERIRIMREQQVLELKREQEERELREAKALAQQKHGGQKHVETKAST